MESANVHREHTFRQRHRVYNEITGSDDDFSDFASPKFLTTQFTRPTAGKIRMPTYIAGLYITTGLLVTGFVFALFPPVPGYKPTWTVVALAALTYVLLWPFLGLMGLGYLVGRLYRRKYGDDELSVEPLHVPRRLRQRVLFDEAHLQN